MPTKKVSAKKKQSSFYKIIVSFLLLIGIILGILFLYQSFDTRSQAAISRNLMSATELKKLPLSCRSLFSIISTSYDTQCGSNRYRAVADLNMDKSVTISDFSRFAANATDNEWCQIMLQSKANPCSQQTSSCVQLFSQVRDSFGSQCGTGTYNKFADINKDKIVNIADFSLVAKNYNFSDWCTKVQETDVDACTMDPSMSNECRSLWSTMQYAFGSQCGSGNLYSPLVDFNQDKIVNISDFSIFSSKMNQGWCTEQLKVTSNPCTKSVAGTPVPTGVRFPTTPVTTNNKMNNR